MDYRITKDIDFFYNKVVIGSSLEALLYCFLTNVPFVYQECRCPHRFSFFESDIDLSCFGIQNTPRVLISPTGEKQVGAAKDILWEKLYFYLSLAGLNPLADKLSSIKLENDILKTFTRKGGMAKIKFNQLIVFDTEGFIGIPDPEFITPKRYKIYDWINVRRGLKHQFDLIEDPDTFFACSIIFYPTDRIDGDQVYKDACVISYLAEEELDDYQYSDINARFKTLYMMKAAGIKGPRNGYHPTEKTKQLYRGLKIETSHREKELLNQNRYKSTDNIIFNVDTFDDIIKKHNIQESYVSTIFKRRTG